MTADKPLPGSPEAAAQQRTRFFLRAAIVEGLVLVATGIAYVFLDLSIWVPAAVAALCAAGMSFAVIHMQQQQAAERQKSSKAASGSTISAEDLEGPRPS